MRLHRKFAVAASTLALATGAAFAGQGPLTDRSDPMGYQPYTYQSYEQGGPAMNDESSAMDDQYFAQPQEYEVYDVYLVPADEIVLIPLQEPADVPISGNELG